LPDLPLSELPDSFPDSFPKADGIAPLIFGCEGAVLSEEERQFFKRCKPFGFILFHRNCGDREQLRALVRDLRDCVGWRCPVLIDQEGGRVARMKPPVWAALPPAHSFGDLTRRHFTQGLEAVALQARALAFMLGEVGIDVNCAPVCDVLQTGLTSDAIGDRAYSNEPEIVALLVKAFIKESAALGMTPVLKHLPGHGRASVDSHYDLPVVEDSLATLQRHDFVPFVQAMATEEAASAWGMVAHMMFPAIDAERPSSLSRPVIEGVIRAQMGFAEAVLVSDDLSMGALGRYGDDAQRAKMTLEAGMDIALHCNGKMADMVKVAQAVPPMSPQAATRIEHWLKARKRLAHQHRENHEDLYDIVTTLNGFLPKATRKGSF